MANDSHSSGWLEILKHLPVKNFYNCAASEKNPNNLTVLNTVAAHRGKYHFLSTGQIVAAGSTAIQLIDAQIPLLELQIQDQTWLLLDDLKLDKQKKLALNRNLPHAQVVWWSGEKLATDLLKATKSGVAIASSATINSDTLSKLRKAKTQVFWTGRDGAIQWTPSGKFETTIEAKENIDFLL